MRRRMYHSNLHDLFYSLIHGGLSALERYISNGGSVNIRGPDRISLVIGAIIEHKQDVFLKCLELGFDVEAADEGGRTALHWAASEGLDTYINTLVAHGATVNTTDNVGNTALIVAAESDHVNVVRKLIQAGSDVNIQNTDFYAALHYSCLKMNFEILELLLSSSSNTFLRTCSGQSPISFSLGNKDIRTVQKILEHNGGSCEGTVYSPDLLTSVEKKYNDAIQMFLAYGVDPFPTDDSSTWHDILTSGSSRRLRESLISNYGFVTTSGPENRLMTGIVKRHQFLKYFSLLKLMFGYGYQLHSLLSESTCPGKCMCRRVLRDLADGESPGSLQTLCRTSIRASLRFGVVRKVASLSLPPKMKRFICMVDEFCLEKPLI